MNKPPQTRTAMKPLLHIFKQHTNTFNTNISTLYIQILTTGHPHCVIVLQFDFQMLYLVQKETVFVHSSCTIFVVVVHLSLFPCLVDLVDVRGHYLAEARVAWDLADESLEHEDLQLLKTPPSEHVLLSQWLQHLVCPSPLVTY